MPMKPRVPRTATILLLVTLGCVPCTFAQERRGPPTLENLLDAPAEAVPQGTLSQPQDGTPDPMIRDAWERYEKAVRAASAGLSRRIGEAARRAKPPSDSDAAAGLEAARKGFVERGLLPSLLDASLRDARRDAEAAYAKAAVALRQQYDGAAARLRKDGRAEEAEAVTQEWDLLQNALNLAAEPQHDSTWIHSITNGPSAEITLYSNGAINAPDGPDRWNLTGTTLVIRWQNPDAPGGEWIDTCEVSRNAGSYAGANQLGTRISGKRVP